MKNASAEQGSSKRSRRSTKLTRKFKGKSTSECGGLSQLKPNEYLPRLEKYVVVHRIRIFMLETLDAIK